MSWNLLKHAVVKQHQQQPSQLLLKYTFGKLVGSRRSFAINLEEIRKRLMNASRTSPDFTESKPREKMGRKQRSGEKDMEIENDSSFKPNHAVVNGMNDNEGITLTFLGTSAGGATVDRNATSLALEMFDNQYRGATVWLVDCAEGTLLQLAKAGIRITRIDRIFITHLHLDHVGGLPSLLAGLSSADSNLEIDLYGPPGLYHFIACNLICTSTKLHTMKVRIHEFGKVSKEVETLNNTISKISTDPSTAFSIHKFAENCLPIERFTIDPTSPKLWKVLERSNIEILAGLLQHSVPCFGYVFQEKGASKKLVVEKIKKLGIKEGPIRRWLKYAPFGEVVTIPAGKESGLKKPITINTKEFQELTFLPRKIVILGDTCDSSSLLEIGKDADVLVHEATVTEGSTNSIHNHSSPEMAARFATKLKAKTLILTHLSKKGARDHVLPHALFEEASNFFYGELLIAYDFFQYNVPRKEIDQNVLGDKGKEKV